MEHIIANPEVAAVLFAIAKAFFELRPRTIEEVGSVEVALDQHVGVRAYKTYININISISRLFTVSQSINLMLCVSDGQAIILKCVCVCVCGGQSERYLERNDLWLT